MYQFSYVKVSSTNQDENLVMLDGPGRVRRHKTSVVCQIQRFDFDCNLVATRKVIMETPLVLGINHLYIKYPRTCNLLLRDITRISQRVMTNV